MQGHPDLMAFWKALGGKDGTGVSYASARFYHFDRDPAISYLTRILEVFPHIRPEWLLSGSGPPTRAEAIAHAEASGDSSPAHERTLFEPALWRPLTLAGRPPGEGARAAILSLWAELLRTEDPQEVVEELGGGGVETRGHRVAHALTEALRSPLNILEDHWSVFPQEELDTYLTLLAEALRQFVRGSWRAEQDRRNRSNLPKGDR